MKFIIQTFVACIVSLVMPAQVLADEHQDKKPSKLEFHVIIPAHMESSRLPGKALLDIEGKSMLQRTFDQVQKAKPLSITIATDDERIRQAALQFSAKVIMTKLNHPNGTSRVAEAAELLSLQPKEIVVNVPSDEPMIEPDAIRLAARTLLEHPDASVGTLSAIIQDRQTFEDPNIVKLVKDNQNFALYFSRAMIPFPQSTAFNLEECLGHIGVYAYSVASLNEYHQADISMLEQVEKLEQLRFQAMGKKIIVAATQLDFMGVNTQEDLDKVRNIVAKTTKQ